MKDNPPAAYLIELIETYDLASDDPKLATILRMAQRGMLSQGMAKAYLHQVEKFVDHKIDHPVFLHRPPTEEDLYEDGRPDIELGGLVDDPSLRWGISLTKVSHLCIVGMSGSGKTTCIRRMIDAVEEINRGQAYVPNRA